MFGFLCTEISRLLRRWFDAARNGMRGLRTTEDVLGEDKQPVMAVQADRAETA